MPVDKNGFLGKGIEEYKQSVESKYKDIFELAYELNKYAQEIKYEFKVRNDDGQGVIASSLYIRVLNGYQGVIILLKYGLTIESTVILRSILETLFVLKRICEDKDYVIDYVKSDEKNRLKLMNIAHENPSAMFEILRKHASEELRVELREKIKKEDISEIKLESLAIKAGMRNFYDSAYRILCETSHPTPRAIEKYGIYDKNENIKSFKYGPIEDGFSYSLITAIGILSMSLKSILKLFKLNEENKIKYFEEKEKRLIIRYLKNDAC